MVTIPLAVHRNPEIVQKDVSSSVIPFPQGKGCIAKYMDAGMDGYIAKPLDATQLADVLEQLIGPAAEAGTAS